MSSMISSAMSCRASSVQSHWVGLRPSGSGRSQARRTTWIAPSGGKTTLGPAARGVGEPCQALGEKALGPLAHHRPLDAQRARHGSLGVPFGQEEENLPPSCQPGGNRGGTLPVLQGVTFLGGQENA